MSEETQDPAVESNEYPTSEFCENVQNHFLALVPTIWVPTYEEVRVLPEIYRATFYLKARAVYAFPQNVHFGLWSITQGLQVWDTTSPCSSWTETLEKLDKHCPIESSAKLNALEILNWLSSYDHDIILVLKDFHRFLEDAVVSRALRDFTLAPLTPQRGAPKLKTAIIVSPLKMVPDDFCKSIRVLNFNLPSVQDFLDYLLRIEKSVTSGKNRKNKENTEEQFQFHDRDEIVKTAVLEGKTMEEFETDIAIRLIKYKK